jgi:colanic acid/amylovoran biosynthesis glycosyltransferase
MRLAYLTNLYARASDSFVRGEVRELRALGHTVETFSIRRPDESELVSDEVRAEYDRTDYLLAHGPGVLAAAAARRARRRPGAFAQATRLAAQVATPGARGRLWPYAYLLEAAYLAERLEALEVEHVHDHIAEGSASVAMLASKLSGVPYSVTVHGPGEFDRAERLSFDLKLAHAAFFAAISEFARGQLMRWTRPQDWDRIHVVHCGIERRFLEREPAPLPQAPRFVSIGRLDVEKGQQLLLDAVAQLPEVELTLVGDGPLRETLERRAERLGIADRVEFAGWRGAHEVLAHVEASRALVLASFAEGLPVVVMEALALGRPVIATDVAAMGELVEPGATGWLVPAGAVEPLVSAMRAAAQAPVAELERLGAAGARRVRERHDPAVEAGKLAALIEGAGR